MINKVHINRSGLVKLFSAISSVETKQARSVSIHIIISARISLLGVCSVALTQKGIRLNFERHELYKSGIDAPKPFSMSY